MKQITLLIILLILLRCDMDNSKQNTKNVVQSMNQPSRSLNDLKKAVLQNGDKKAYRELSIAYLDEPFQEELLLYAIIMANKYNNLQAYFDVFTCLTDIYLSDLSKLDENTASLAIDYLLKAYEKGHHQAKDMVEKYELKSNENSKRQIEKIFKD